MRPIVLVFVSLCLALSLSAEKQRPNIVLIISDDQSWTDYSFMGHDVIQTPHIDKLASESVVFRRGYVPTALCRPALMTMATGLYAHQNLITGNDPVNTPANLAYVEESGVRARELMIQNIDKHPSIAKRLTESGYLSFQSGKWWEGSYKRGGFTHGMTRGFPEKGGRHGDDGLKIGRKGMASMFDFIQIAQKQEKPFFIWYAPFLPHTPHNPPERLLKKYRKADRSLHVAKYYAMCDWFDETCGELLGHLDEKGLSENTLVIYVTDNGWIQHPKRPTYAARSKRSPYEGGTRTPIMFRWPAKFKPQEREELCSSIDLVPTILAAAGLEVPKKMPGLNLLPHMAWRMPLRREYILGENFAHDVPDMKKPEASLLYRWVIKGDYKLLLTYDGREGFIKYPATDPSPQLYDLRNDPHERTNLAASNTELVSELNSLIESWYPLTERKAGVLPSPEGRVRPKIKRKSAKQ